MNGPTRQQQQASSDRDSLVALDALLRIRQSDAMMNSAMAKSTGSPSTSAFAAARWGSLLPLTAANALMACSIPHDQRHNGIPATQAQYRWAAARASVANTWGNTLLAARNASSPSFRNGSNDGVASRFPITADTPDGGSGARMAIGATISTASTDREKYEAASALTSESTILLIRKEKVEEALHSKHQRGRKRDDLSSKERLELTRTRNREHAKSTRIRKKARYQELLDREALYLEMEEQENLEIERRQCIQDFFEMRQSMLLDKVLQFKQTVQPTPQLAKLADVNVPFELDLLVPDGVNAASDDAVSKMIEWDETLLHRMKITFDACTAEVLSSLQYEIESVALNKTGDAFCRVKLYVQVPLSSNASTTEEAPNKSKLLIMSAICVFTFVSQSNRLRSLKWITLEDMCSCAGESETLCIQPSCETLSSQLVHPSVVSLGDHTSKHVELDERSHGPGMII